MAALPSGTVTFLFTDVVGSTAGWERDPAAMSADLARHDHVLRSAIARHGGYVFATGGDGFAAAFSDALPALQAAMEAQAAVGLPVRMGLHTGTAEERDGNYFGRTLNRAARLMAAGHGGQILLSDTAVALVRDDVAVRDLGEHRLADLGAPMRVWQVGSDTFPRLRSIDRARHNLPVQTTPRVGRELDIAAVRGLLDEHRLVTLVGFGGVGKTRLALDVAALLAVGDADGVWFVDLAAVTDPAMVPVQIASALGIKESGTGAADAVVEDLRAKRLLLVLDNLEQVLACAPFVSRVLAEAPEVAILATSREPLRVRGEYEYAVDTLPSADAVALFATRAHAVRAGFSVTPVVAAICERLDGLPLAIELAAARMKVLTAEALLPRLDSALNVLTGGGRDRPERHQTLRATIAWSYDALPLDERALLNRLSVFPGSMTFDAIEEVCAPPMDPHDAAIDVLDAVTGLVEKSLLRANDVDDHTKEPRYDLLVSVREFARERLSAAGAEAELARRHADFYARLNRFQGVSRDEGAMVVRRVEQELHNMRAALRWTQTHGTADEELNFSTFILVLVDAGHFEEARAAALHALGRDEMASAGRVRTLAALGYLYWHTSESTAEREVLEQQLAAARDLGEPSLLASALIDTLPNATTRDAALTQLAEIDTLIDSLAPSGSEVPLWYLSELLDNRVSISLRYADPERALRAARAYRVTTQFDPLVAGMMLAQLCVDRGRWAEALDTLRDVQDHAGVRWSGEEIDDIGADEDGRQGVLRAMWVRLLAQALIGRGDIDQAVRHAEHAVRHMRSGEMPHWLAVNHVALASCYAAAGRLTDARAHLETAGELVHDDARRHMIGWRIARLDRLLHGRKDDLRERITAMETSLCGIELSMLLELLGTLVEHAHHLIDEDPAAAARCVARVQRDGVGFAIPLGAGDDVDGLLRELAERLGETELSRIVADVQAQPLWTP